MRRKVVVKAQREIPAFAKGVFAYLMPSNILSWMFAVKKGFRMRFSVLLSMIVALKRSGPFVVDLGRTSSIPDCL